MRPRISTSVPYYKGSMSAPPILTNRDLSGKYILVRIFTMEGFKMLTVRVRTNG